MKTIKTTLLIMSCFALCQPWQAFAQVVVSDNTSGKSDIVNTVAPGSFGSPVIQRAGGSLSVCLDNTNTANPQNETFSLGGISLSNLTVSWVLTGGLAKVGTPTATSVVIKPIAVNNKFVPGQLTAVYKGTKDSTITCGSSPQTIQVPKFGSVSIKLAQKFSSTIAINGADCITSGDEVNFSVSPLASSNLDADGYNWQSVNVAFSPLSYQSFDNSSFTSTVGNIAFPCSLIVNMGVCNTGIGNQKIKVFRQKIAKPNATVAGFGTNKKLCVPVSTTFITLNNANPDPAVDYYWSWDNTNYTLGSGTLTGTSILLSINNVNPGSGKIYLQAKPKAGNSTYCMSNNQPVYDTITISRSLTGATISGTTCTNLGASGLSYTISPNPGISVLWAVPTGWTKSADANGSIVASVGTNAIAGTITATASGTCAGTISLPIGIKASDLTGVLNGPACISYGSIAKLDYSIPTTSPAGTYQWTLPSGWTAIAPATLVSAGVYTTTSTTINTLPNGTSTGQISVVPLGNCASGSGLSKQINFSITPPTGIDFVGTKNCINANGAGASNNPDVVNLKVSNPVVGNSYSWSVSPSTWILNSTSNGQATNDLASFATTGDNGTYTVTVSANSPTCPGTSSSFGRQFVISPNTARLDSNFDAITEIYRFVVRDKTTNGFFPDGTSFKWYKNGLEIAGQTKRYLNLGNGASALTNISVDVTPIGSSCSSRLSLTTRNANQLRMASLDDETTTASISASPNPANSEFVIRLTALQGAEVSIVSQSTGVSVKQFTATSTVTKVNTSGWASGMYMVIANANGKRYTTPVVVQQ